MLHNTCFVWSVFNTDEWFIYLLNYSFCILAQMACKHFNQSKSLQCLIMQKLNNWIFAFLKRLKLCPGLSADISVPPKDTHFWRCTFIWFRFILFVIFILTNSEFILKNKIKMLLDKWLRTALNKKVPTCSLTLNRPCFVHNSNKPFRIDLP